MFVTVARNTAAQFLTVLVSFADRFLVVGILLHAWGPEVYSEWAVLLSSAGLLVLGELGLNIIFGNALQHAWATGDRLRFQRLVSIGLSTCLGAGVVWAIIAAAAFAIVDFPQSLSVTEITHSQAVLVLAVLGAASILRIPRSALSQIWRGRQEYAVGSLVTLIHAGGLPALMIIAGLVGASPLVMAIICLLAEIVLGWGAMVWLLRRQYPDINLTLAAPTSTELSDVAHQVKWLAIQQGGPLAWLQVPIVMMGHLGVTGTALVSFLILRTLVNFVRTLGTLLAIGSGVEIAVLHHAGRQAELIHILRKVGFGLSITSTILAAGVLVFGKQFVVIWTGQAGLYDNGTVLCLLASAVLCAPGNPISTHMMLANLPRANSIAMLVQLGIGFAGCALLTPYLGMLGAALALAAGEIVGQAVVLPLLAMRHLPNFGYRAYLRDCTLAMGLTAAWCLAIGYAVTHVIDDHSFIGFAAATLVWLLLAAVPVVLVAMGPHHRGALPGRLRHLMRSSGKVRSGMAG
jgi:O-antigen/teichoic acid export membrane protein